MFRPASRVLLRLALFRPIARPNSRKLLSTASPAEKSRSWKNSAVRWGLAAAAVYYYNTHDVFAEEPAYAPPATEVDDSESLLTIEQIAAQRRARLIKSKESASNSIQVAPVGELVSEDDSKSTVEGLEQEADQQGAFNPETGEINWDCPCLGGMANGPCGEEFKAAFSCFVYSKEEPKGMDCIDKFKGMQDCFRLYPDIYGAELEDDDDDVSADDVSADELGVPAASPESAVVPVAIPQTPAPAGAAILSNREEEEASSSSNKPTGQDRESD